MRASILLIALAGCLEPTVLPCGNDICPTTSVCIDDAVCATPDQIQACDGVADAGSCHSETGDGYCTDGVCTPNVCGDGQLTGTEQCDGSLISLTCQDFGYYTGATTCSSLCTIDRSGCSGRCGDGIVQADQGEECDGSPPSFNCTDIGFDYGALTCSATCAADPIDSCGRFGWHKLGPIDYPGVVSGDVGMYAIMDKTSIEIHEATVSTHQGTYVAIDARGGDVLAATATTVERYHAGTWTTLPPPNLPSGEMITEAKIADDGTTFVLATGGACSIASYDGTIWTIGPGPSGCLHLSAFATGDFAVAVSDGSVRWQFPGCDPSPGPCQCQHPYEVGDATAVAFAMPRLDAGSLTAYVSQSSNSAISAVVVPQCGGGPPTVAMGTASGTLVLRGTEVFGSLLPEFGFTVFRVGEDRIEDFAGAPSVSGEPPNLWATHDGAIYAQGDGSLYRLDQLNATQRSAPGETPVFPGKTQMALASDGTFVECSEHVSITTPTSGNGFQQLGSLSCATNYPCCSALFAASATSIYATLAPASTPELEFWNGSTWTVEMLDAAPIDATAIAGNGTIAVAVNAGQVITNQSGAWAALPALPTSCSASTVGCGADGTIYVGGGCTQPATAAVIWSYDSSQAMWVELESDATQTSYGSMSIGSDGSVFAATGQRIEVGTNNAWTAYDNAGAVVTAVTATDAFATSASLPIIVNQWDGSRWSPINVNPDNYYFAIAAGPSDLAVYGSLRVSNPTPVWQSFIRVP